MNAVSNMNTLKAMERAGHIELHNQTGTKLRVWYGPGTTKISYVWNGKHSFTYKGNDYTTKYVPGCFCPYVFKVNR